MARLVLRLEDRRRKFTYSHATPFKGGLHSGRRLLLNVRVERGNLHKEVSEQGLFNMLYN